MDTAVEVARTPSVVPDDHLHRIAGIAGILAGALAILANLLHPRFGDLNDTEAVLDGIADYPLWRIDHLAIVLSVALGVAALAGVSRSMTELPAAAWARVALTSALVMGAVTVASFALDGFALAGVAEDWSGAPAQRGRACSIGPRRCYMSMAHC